MSTELRAPDPTLTALGDDGIVTLDLEPIPAVAHHWDCPADCDPSDRMRRYVASVARWFAVPCRECFPSNLPRGSRWMKDTEGHDVSAIVEDPGLAWQVRARKARLRA